MKRIKSQITILIAHVLRVLFALISSPQANDHAIPSPTTASTLRRSTILITTLTISRNTDWNPARPVGIVHSYFLLITSPQHASPVASYSVFQVLSVHLTQTQLAHGTFSDVNILFAVGADGLLSTVCQTSFTVVLETGHTVYPILNTNPDETVASMRMSIFCIFLDLELDKISHEAESCKEYDRRDTRIDEDRLSFFDAFFVTC